LVIGFWRPQGESRVAVDAKFLFDGLKLPKDLVSALRLTADAFDLLAQSPRSAADVAARLPLSSAD
jgi:hypothetical protein